MKSVFGSSLVLVLLLTVAVLAQPADSDPPTTREDLQACGPVFGYGQRIPLAEYRFELREDTLYFAGLPFQPTRRDRFLEEREQQSAAAGSWDGGAWHAVSVNALEQSRMLATDAERRALMRQLYLAADMTDPDSLKADSGGFQVYRTDLKTWCDIRYPAEPSPAELDRVDPMQWWQDTFWSVVRAGGLFAFGDGYHVYNPAQRNDQVFRALTKMAAGRTLLVDDYQDTALCDTWFREDLQKQFINTPIEE
ncbi:MAG: hypothetical protein ABIF77_18320 [bacterium]